MANSPTLKKLIKQNPSVKIKASEIYFIENKVFVTSAFIQARYGITARQLTNWRIKGLESSEYSLDGEKGTKLYELDYLVQWQDENIDKKKSKNAKGQKSVESSREQPYSDTDIDDVPEHEADRLLKIEKVKIERIKLAEMKKELIPADDTDKAMAEIGAIHVAQYQGDLKLLPILLEMKPKHEITVLLDEHYKARVEDMSTIANRKKVDGDTSLFDGIAKFIKSIKDD